MKLQHPNIFIWSLEATTRDKSYPMNGENRQLVGDEPVEFDTLTTPGGSIEP